MEQNVIPHITIDQVSWLITKLSDDVLLSIHTLKNTNPILQCLHLLTE